jgi:hypothetical protein
MCNCCTYRVESPSTGTIDRDPEVFAKVFFFWKSSAPAEGAVTSLNNGVTVVRIAAKAASGSAARCAGAKPVCRTERSSRQQMLSPP